MISITPTVVNDRPAQPRTVRVTLARSGVQEQDEQKLRRIHRLFIEHPGEDRFVIQLVSGGSPPVELAFPNDSTRYCADLVDGLAGLVGPGSIELDTVENEAIHAQSESPSPAPAWPASSAAAEVPAEEAAAQ